MSQTLENLKNFALERSTGAVTQTAVPRVDILNVREPTELFPEIYQPLVSLILQGRKRLSIGSEVLEYGPGDTFIASVELPVVGEVVQASPSAPYLALSLTFKSAAVAELMKDAGEQVEMNQTRTFNVYRASEDLLNAWTRLLHLADRPHEIGVMAPMLEREILFRLLLGPQGAILRQVASVDSRFSRIRAVLAWIRKNYTAPFRAEQLAKMAGMSVSAFHRAFKASVGLSALQYQKHIRLYEGRRMLFASPGNVSVVALTVGYQSLSQFTREYTRMFGIPPARDVKSLRQN
ncbi:AraC family transcriptional regulator [Shinella curvata]|uniref:AraC family transcriptional regulator n=1 Tax=Shinella curvata TaxID=1817964 RepID=A0ABT8XK96_9HYPH|nr:AraC family transcriptional regulator [Shinella curvata]MCJ8056805.1 AraC family transcriptional regulator [Shinella curvata]MDO6124141.1 AraC family transcriptional regulator [Shinella curvata]